MSAIRFSRRSARFIPSGIAGLIVSLFMGLCLSPQPLYRRAPERFRDRNRQREAGRRKRAPAQEKQRELRWLCRKTCAGVCMKNSKTGPFIAIGALFFLQKYNEEIKKRQFEPT